ncbi:MAG: APC family permease [Acidobacteria bacterium]|nr:APC family permease [Acidobacteriota bacterium]MBV9475384.1 APC family permease [Acidobacteriota bacterium]
MSSAQRHEEPSDSLLPGESFADRVQRRILGERRDLTDPHALHKISLIAFLAWVGLGADGLSSSAYGPEEAFRALGEHHYLALGLALATGITVLILSASYSSIIEQFPTGGGGYVVASRLLGPRIGVISGCALVVDYILTITVSIASGGNAIFSFLPASWHAWKMAIEVAAIVLLIALNLRGVKESVKVLTPIFLVFLATHALLIGWAIFTHAGAIPEVSHRLSTEYAGGLATLGAGGMLLLFLRAYSLGGGTYTGIEAVSNGLQIMREPRVHTGKKTMVYMAVSLALTASGILIAYLLLQTRPLEGKTMNAVLSETAFGAWHLGALPVGYWLVLVTLISEGLLLFVAAQAGFIDGPRVMANMAVDSFFPHRFAALSEQLSMHNGVMLMGGAALAMLFYTKGNIHVLVVMYSINVFLTFTLSQLGMWRFWWPRRGDGQRAYHIFIHGLALAMCAAILVVTIFEKFGHGGWVTAVITALFVLLCLRVRRHYDSIRAGLRQLDDILGSIPTSGTPNDQPLAPNAPTAVILVSGFNGLGVHTILSTLRFFPGLYKQFIFVSIAVVDSGHFKGREEIEALQRETDEQVQRYVSLTRRLGFPAEGVTDIGTEVVAEATIVCERVARDYPKATIISGKLVFRQERMFNRLLHNETPTLIQRRLQWLGVPMVVLPVRASV